MPARLTLSDRGEAESLWGAHLGPVTDWIPYEALRYEVYARQSSTKRVVCDAALKRLTPFSSWTREDLRRFLDELDNMGDVSSAPGGRVAPASLRLVRLGDGRYALYGGMPDALVGPLPAGVGQEPGLQRYLIDHESQEEELRIAIEALGGRMISPERWTGLDRSPKAGPEWLERLSSRLESESLAPSAWDQEALDPWRIYSPDALIPGQRKRWAKANSETTGQLWRARHSQGWWVYAWCPTGSPESSPALKLRHEEALRTAFSLDLEADAPLTFAYRSGPEIELSVDAFLPLPEYRLLNVTGLRDPESERGSYRYRFQPDAWAKVSSILIERLGIQLEESSS